MSTDKKGWPKIKNKYWRCWRGAPIGTGAYVVFLLLLLMCLICCTATYLLWCTSTLNSTVQYYLTYRRGSMFFNKWRNPDYTPITRVYMYNYTNTQEFLRGDTKKLKVQEVGPFTYKEEIGKVDAEFHNDTILSFRDKRFLTFLPELSVGSDEELAVVPNLPLICAFSQVHDQGLAAQMGVRSILWAISGDTSAFYPVEVRNYTFGYYDRFYDVISDAAKLTGTAMPDLGVLRAHVNIGKQKYTIHSGADDYSLIDVVAEIGGKPDLDIWGDPECDRIDGAAGAIYDPAAVAAKAPISLFSTDLCRLILLEFKEEVTVESMGGMTAYRYTTPENFFHNGTDNPANACFQKGSFTSHPTGVFYQGACNGGTPIFASYPRYYQGDPSLREMVEGMSAPNTKDHEFQVDIHPKLGFPLRLALRIQVNIMIRKAPFAGSYLDQFEDNVILPLLWFDTMVDGYHEPTRSLIWHLTYTMRWAEKALQYMFPALAVLLAVLAARSLHRCVAYKAEKGLSQPTPDTHRLMAWESMKPSIKTHNEIVSSAVSAKRTCL